MCGIVGYTGRQAAAPLLLQGLQQLEYRGYDSAGLAVQQPGGLAVAKTSGRIASLAEQTDGGAALPGVCGIGHTRWATHGAPTRQNAHPQLSGDGRFAVVHNGIIENYLALRQELEGEGIRFRSQTDTEVIAHLIQKYHRGDLLAAVRQAVDRLQGSYALGVLWADAPGVVVAARRASPLILGLGQGENFFASDVTALVAHTRQVLPLEDGELALLTPDQVRVFGPSGEPVCREPQRVDWSLEQAEKGGFAHFMLKETMEQPAALRAALAPRLDRGRLQPDAGFSLPELRQLRRICITACGSSYYAGCAGRYSLEALCRLPVEVELASELRYDLPRLGPDTLVILLSQSGETADTLAALREVRRQGARTLAIVNVVGSSLAVQADHTLYTWAGPEIAVATTKGYTTQLGVLYWFALYAAQALGRIGPEEAARLAGELEALPRKLEQTLALAPRMEQLAPLYSARPSVFYIGRSADYAAALEGALKMKEVAYLHAEAYPAGELKHGTIALVEPGQPVVALCCGRRIAEKTLNNLLELKARGARVLALTLEDLRGLLAPAEDLVCLPETDPLFQPLLEVPPLQLLAYYAARARGCDIDKPRNLAKSVTVE